MAAKAGIHGAFMWRLCDKLLNLMLCTERRMLVSARPHALDVQSVASLRATVVPLVSAMR
jgi:hypothetical protein